jgi:uncharacterized protein (UPF0332 family)
VSEREVRELLDKARRSLRAAERLLDGNDHDFAISRAYYAMFYAAQALLLGRGIRRSKHAGVLRTGPKVTTASSSFQTSRHSPP